jgi:hypothetical protein
MKKQITPSLFNRMMTHTKTISGNYAGGLIRLNGADNVTFDGRVGGSGRYLTFKNTSTSSSAVFHIISQGTNAGATDNTIRNCIIEAGANTNGIFGIFAGSSTLGLAGNDNDNLSIIDNIVSKSYSAIEVIATESGVNDNIVITGNIIGSEFSGSYIGKYGIAVQRASGADISGNTVFNVISATDNTIGIRSHFTTSTTIAGNLIHSISYTGPSFNGGMGIDINNAGNHSSNLTIANNVIYDISGTGFSGGDQAIQGIRIQNNQGGINIYYNSINLYGSISRSAATVDRSFSIFIGTGVTNLDIRDNIFANSINNTSGVATAYAIYCESAASAFTDINHNDYFASGPEGVLGFLGSNRTLLAQWQGATGKDGNSIASDPLFNSNENLRPQAGSPVLGAGTPIGGITTDFLGVTRGNPPSIGAYEEAGDFGAPVIVYTPLTNTFLTENRTLSNVLITDATGVDWTANKPRIYYKKATDNNVFGGNTSTDNGWKWTEANTSLSPTNFTIDYSIIFGGSVSQGQTIQYFVVAQDISDPPLVGSNPSVGFVGSSVSSITSAPVSPNQYIIQSGPMSGDYTVGSTGTYATLTLAVQDLNMRGVGGPVKLLLNDAAYSSETFPVVIDVEDNLPTETNTVTIKPNIGVTASISGSSSTQIIKILNSFVTIDGSNISEGTSRDLTIENSNTDDFNRSVILIGSKETTAITDVEIKNTNVKSRYDNDAYFGPAAVLLSDQDGLSFGRFNNVTIRNNKIMRANYGIYCIAQEVIGNGSGLLITENDLNDAADPLFHCGIYVAGVDGAVISKNKIANIDGSYTQNDKGIEISYTTNTIVEANTINTLTGPAGWGANGIYISTFLTNANILVKNNVIFNITGIGYDYEFAFMNNPHGICLEYDQSGIKIYNNSIHLYGNTLNQANAISSGIALGSGSIADIRNNIIVNTLGLQSGTGYGRVGIFLQTDTTQLSSSSNNNLIYVNPSSGSGVKYIGQVGTSPLSSIQLWRFFTNRDKYSFSGDPAFTSNTNLLPNSSLAACWAVNNKGMPLALVPTDFNGNSRSTTRATGPVDIGAFEFDALTNPPDAIPGGPPIGNGQTSTYNVFEFEAGSLIMGCRWYGTFRNHIQILHRNRTTKTKSSNDNQPANVIGILIVPAAAGLRYNVTFNYVEAQIGNIAESDLRLAKSDDNGLNWIPLSSIRHRSESVSIEHYQQYYYSSWLRQRFLYSL